ncbi:hypothetical protein DY000_02044011 [Brassica cretica]|uniref:AIPP2-like SPOC-like domain-containing protein n=1 Tax=Brassica cretica TaxID=69181 RepID=A0ABQ7BAS0_BRACR|nr:hypothetical protein DY000_02044011 [Brassica cretica]
MSALHGVVASQCSFNEGDLLRSSRLNDTSSSEHSESQEVVRSSSDHQDRDIPRQGKIKGKSGAESNEVKKSVFIESSETGMVGESGEYILSNKAEEPDTSAMSESESADSDPMEVDVKVCDTCGYAGREDLLAICSRCSDGAEHTYCMRVMLKNVPECDWLCEECKFAEQAEKQKRDKETKRKKETEVNLNTQSSSKRRIDKPESSPDTKRQAVEAPTGSPKRPVLPRLPAFSRETSFKGLEKTTRKLAHHSSFSSHSSDDAESARSTDSQVQSPRACTGSLFKSKSFNFSSSRPKVRPVDDVMPKEGLSRKLGRSMSTRCIDAGSSGCNDSRVQGSKQLKDRSTEASGVDQKLISRGNSSSSYANSARDLKSLHFDGKEGSLTKKARHLSRNRLEDIVASVGDTHTNEKCKDAVGSRRRSSLKDLSSQKGQTAEPVETSCSSGSNLSTTQNISEDVNKGNRLRAAVDAALRKKPSFGKNRGLEQSDLPSVSNGDSSCDRALQNFPSKVHRDWPVGLQGGQAIAVNRKQSTLPGADAMAAPQSIEPAAHLHSVKPVIRDLPVGLQRGRPNLQTDKEKIAVNRKQSTLPGPEAMSAPQTLEPAVHLHSVKPVVRDLPVGLQGGTIAVNRKQFPLASADAMAASQSVEPTVHLPSVKPAISDLPVVDPSVLSKTSAIPEHEYIWQGEMEVRKSRNPSAMQCGMQAYLSTLASPKVAEVVNQFPVKVTLNEVPRLSTWPSQFQDIGAKEGHVALFFFAKDIESYERSYKPLVDNMIQKDLALKGYLEGVELLIFASNQLPRNCQRWNMFFFLWGVFRGKKEKCPDPLNKNKPLPASNFLPNMGRVFSTREDFYNENPSNRESSINCPSSRMQSCMKEEKAKEGEAGGGDSGAAEETEEGEIGFSPQLRDGKISGPRRVNSSDMNQKVDMDDLNSEGLCEGPANKKLKTGTGVETKCNIFRRDATERIVFPLDLNDGKEDDTEMVDDNPRALGNDGNIQRSLGMVPNLELALGEDETTTTTGVVLPFMTGPSATEKHRSSNSQKAEEDNAASLSLSLSFSSLEKEQQQQQQQRQQQNQRRVSGWEQKKQNVNTPMFLFRDFPDKSS